LGDSISVYNFTVALFNLFILFIHRPLHTSRAGPLINLWPLDVPALRPFKTSSATAAEIRDSELIDYATITLVIEQVKIHGRSIG